MALTHEIVQAFMKEHGVKSYIVATSNDENTPVYACASYAESMDMIHCAHVSLHYGLRDLERNTMALMAAQPEGEA